MSETSEMRLVRAGIEAGNRLSHLLHADFRSKDPTFANGARAATEEVVKALEQQGFEEAASCIRMGIGGTEVEGD